MAQLIKYDDKVTHTRNLLEKLKPQMRLALPRHLSPDRMARLALTAVQRTPELLDADAKSFAGAIMQAAQLGLEPDGVLGHLYLLPFRNNRSGKTEVNVIVGYKGLIDLARRSGQISSIDARVVREGDTFKFAFGLNPVLEHTPAGPAPDGKERQITHAYAVIRLKDGGYQFDVLTRAEIETVRKGSRAGQSGPWVTHFAEMAKKTALRRALKLAPMAVEAQRAVALDEMADAGESQGLAEIVDVSTGEVYDAEVVKANGDGKELVLTAGSDEVPA